MNKEFIPYEQALELKELGFNEECMAMYHLIKIDGIIKSELIFQKANEDISEVFTRAPLYQQAFRWVREKYKLLGLPKPYGYEIQYNAALHYWGTIIEKEANTYEEAELACLKKLIETAKNK